MSMLVCVCDMHIQWNRCECINFGAWEQVNYVHVSLPTGGMGYTYYTYVSQDLYTYNVLYIYSNWKLLLFVLSANYCILWAYILFIHTATKGLYDPLSSFSKDHPSHSLTWTCAIGLRSRIAGDWRDLPPDHFWLSEKTRDSYFGYGPLAGVRTDGLHKKIWKGFGGATVSLP